MRIERRDFLRIGGLCALGLGAIPAVKALAGNDLPRVTNDPNALTAERWGMVIDLKKCWEEGRRNCDDCIAACHRGHNVPDIGTIKEEIKWIWQESFENVFPEFKHAYMAEGIKGRPATVLCNHCDNPPCTRVCPTKATFKRGDGIVVMDYHRCIGCRFCMAGCPYGARSFNFRDPRPFIQKINKEYPTREAGVVEKCSFCDDRLAFGQKPLCVEACQAQAMFFGDLADPNSEVRKILRLNNSIRREPKLGTEPKIYYLL
jgi:molybdopterin-containing oxidoreductase family iron-sulfur binding subunit